MTQKVYREMLDVMAGRGGLYAGMDIPEFYELMEALFTPEEAEVNNAMPPEPVTSIDLAEQMGRKEEEIEAILEGMADNGLSRTFQEEGVRYFMCEPLYPSIIEFQFIPGKTTERDKKVARLLHNYMKACNDATGPIKLPYPRNRVISVDRTITAGNTIHTYDMVSSYIEKNDTIAVATCMCRHMAHLLGEDTHGMPMDVCMWFGRTGEFTIERLGARRLSKQEAMEILDRCEEAGLVHMSRNVTEDVEFLCNCDRWHCQVMKIIFKQSKPGLFFNSGFEPNFDPDICVACQTCLDRCPASALDMGDDVPEVDLDRCFGCAVCATGCPEEAISMEAKPGFPEPPKDMQALMSTMVTGQRG